MDIVETISRPDLRVVTELNFKYSGRFGAHLDF